MGVLQYFVLASVIHISVFAQVLRNLTIRDYALIEALEVEFEPGLNAITGETGAGKSILIGALKLLLGERADTDAVRAGAKKAVVEGVFDEADGKAVVNVLRENEIEPNESGMLLVRREVAQRYSRAFVNDTPTTLDVLKRVAEETIDLHGQHEHQSLLHPAKHGPLLDAFGDLGEFVEGYKKARQAVAARVEKRDTLVAREAELGRQKELIEFQIQEIDRVDPRLEEQEERKAEHRILENAERLHEATDSLVAMLSEGEEAMYDRLALARKQLEGLVQIDSAFQETLDEVDQAEVILKEATNFLQDYNSRIEFNPERLEEVRERLGDLDALSRKYGGTIEAVLEHRRKIGETFDLATNFEASITKLNEEIDEARKELGTAAGRLSERRREVAERIEAMIGDELAELGMRGARFEVRFSQEEDPEGWAELDLPAAQGTAQAGGRRLKAYADGVDRIEFYIAPNPGEGLRPLAKTASGGEISRIMLALKTILAKSDRLPILVFDEIDAGISGAVARRVGEKMSRLGAYHQIIAITHLAQIAGLANTHFAVEKSVSDDRTRTDIRCLDADERTAQIALLLSGDAESEAALASAKELIGTSNL